MAFEKRTWLARIGTGLNKFIIGDKDGNNKQTLTNSPDTVSQQGDVISAENLNDLEDRIDNEFTADATLIASKADKTYVDTQLGTKQDTLTFDDAPTSGSSNPVKSGGVYTGLAGKQNSLVVEALSAHPDWRSITAGQEYTVEISATKTGYTCIGVLGYNIMALKSNGETAKMSVMEVYYGSANESIYLVVVPTETASVEYNYTRVGVYALFAKNS